MQYEYHVFHDYDAVKKTAVGQMYPFTEIKEQHEYSCFPGTLGHLLIGPGISASVNPAIGRRGVVVTFISDLLRDEIEKSLHQVLVKQNQHIRGLCLVATIIS